MCILHTHLIFFPINNHPFRHIFITTHYAMNSKFITNFIISYRKSKRSFLIWVCQKLNAHTWINAAQLRHFSSLSLWKRLRFPTLYCSAIAVLPCVCKFRLFSKVPPVFPVLLSFRPSEQRYNLRSQLSACDEQ